MKIGIAGFGKIRFEEKKYTGRTYCEKKGIEFYYNSRDHRFYSSGLRKKVKLVQ